MKTPDRPTVDRLNSRRRNRSRKLTCFSNPPVESFDPGLRMRVRVERISRLARGRLMPALNPARAEDPAQSAVGRAETLVNLPQVGNFGFPNVVKWGLNGLDV
jgi:hypothetical protein